MERSTNIDGEERNISKGDDIFVPRYSEEAPCWGLLCLGSAEPHTPAKLFLRGKNFFLKRVDHGSSPI
jgi:hypothetical protein